MSASHRVIAVLKLPGHVPDIIKFAKAVVTGMTNNNPVFPTPTPPLATVTGHIGDLETAETTSKSRTKGTAQARNAKKRTVVSDLNLLKGYAQHVADQNPDTAESIIESAGFSVRRTAVRTKSELTVSQSASSGEIHATAKAARGRASYDWQFSTDQKTWVNAPTTLQAKTRLTGLTSGTTYYFRHRKLTKAGQEDWGPIVSLFVR